MKRCLVELILLIALVQMQLYYYYFSFINWILYNKSALYLSVLVY